MNGLDYKCGLGERLCVGVGSPLGVGCRANLKRTGLRRHKSIGTQITIQYCTYLNLSSAGSSLPAYMTANYHMQNIMQNLISSAPNFTNLIQAYEYVALKRARVTYFNTGIHNLGNVTNNTNYPPVHAAIYYDSYSNPVGLGSNPALVLSKMPGAQSVVGRGTIGKTIYGYAVCKKLNMPIGIRLLLLRVATTFRRLGSSPL